MPNTNSTTSTAPPRPTKAWTASGGSLTIKWFNTAASTDRDRVKYGPEKVSGPKRCQRPEKVGPEKGPEKVSGTLNPTNDGEPDTKSSTE